MDVQKIRQAYASVADVYIGLFGTSGQVHPDDLAFIERHLSDRPRRVFDLGCGPGHLTAHLRSLGVDATGVDPVPEFVAHARATYPDGDYRLGSIGDVDVEDHSAGGILVWYSLIHQPPRDLDGSLAALRRMLAPGGSLVAGIFDGDEVGAFDHKVLTAYRWPVEEFSARLTRAGFTVVEQQRRVDEVTHRPLAAVAAVAQECNEGCIVEPDGCTVEPCGTVMSTRRRRP